MIILSNYHYLYCYIIIAVVVLIVLVVVNCSTCAFGIQEGLADKIRQRKEKELADLHGQRNAHQQSLREQKLEKRYHRVIPPSHDRAGELE